MGADLIDVLVIGHPDPSWVGGLVLADCPATYASGFAVRHLPDESFVRRALAERVPHVIFTFGDEASYGRLAAEAIEIRRRWVHYDEPHEVQPSVAAAAALRVFVDVTTRNRFPVEPLVSVFTPTYRTGEKILRTYRSILAQTYANWEWVIYDDSPDNETFDIVASLATADHRIKLFKSDRNCGVIGEVKRRLCGLARGSILAELDHDDELTPTCLASVVEAFETFPEAGFAYTDCAEVFEDGANASYADGWAFGFGSYRTESLLGRDYTVTNYPGLNAKTVRHIVGMPNHVRAWRRDAYVNIGGYAPEVHVADDYELCIRTFLRTRAVHIRRFGYIQYLSREGANTQRVRNGEIQRLVDAFARRYADEIHDRFVELGVDDFIYNDGNLDWSAGNPSPAPNANYDLL